MIEQLLTSFVFDKLNKQIIKKIPYCLLFALLINYFYVSNSSVGVIIAISFFAVFAISSSYFNYRASKASEDIWTDMDFKKIVGKISSIFEGGASWIKDIGITRSGFIISGFVSGISFTIMMTAVFLLILGILPLDKMIIIAFSIITALYIFQDAAKGNLLDEPEKESKSTLLYDVMDTYMVENSVRAFSIGSTMSRVILAVVTPIIGPLAYFRFPKTSFKELVVLNNDDLKELLRKYQQGHEEIYFKHEGGRVLEDVFMVENDTENITIFSEKSQKNVLPYLLDPEYKALPDDKKKWIAFSIEKRQKKKEKAEEQKEEETEKRNQRIIGHIFIHAFKGRLLTIVNENNEYKRRPKRKDVLLIMIIGERSTVQYLETKISSITAKAPLDKMV